MTQIASLRAETANKKLSKSSSQNYPNSFSENAKAPAPKASDVRKQFGECRLGNQRQLAHCGRNIFWQADKKQGLSTSIASQCKKYLKGYPDFIARRCPKL